MECKNPLGHVFEVNDSGHHYCLDCGEIRKFDPLTKSWVIIQKGK